MVGIELSHLWIYVSLKMFLFDWNLKVMDLLEQYRRQYKLVLQNVGFEVVMGSLRKKKQNKYIILKYIYKVFSFRKNKQ